MDFAYPWILLLILPVLVTAIVLRRRDADPASIRHPHTDLLTDMPTNWRVRSRSILPWIRLLVLVLVIVGLARPRIPHSLSEVQGEGIDIVITLDISGSMRALDFQPDNRLEVAKRIIREFIAARPRDRIGLTLFASRAFTQCPLTLDRSILTGFLDEVEIGLIEDGTAIGLGLATAVNRLRHSEAESKTVILLTDGSNNVPTLEPETAAELAQALGVRVYTIGVGKRGRVPFPRTGAFGTRTVMVEMPIDEELLKSIAEITGGRYWRAENPEALNEVFASIDELETSRYKTSVSTWYDERMSLLILPALLLLLLESLLGATWLRRLP